MTPYFTDAFTNTSQTTSNWYENGSVSESSYLQTPSTAGASLISKMAVPGGTSQYQVTLTGALTYGGTYNLYLEATPDAFLNPSGTSTGSFYAFSLQVPTSGTCTASVSLYKVVAGTVSKINSTTTPCVNSYLAMVAVDGSIRLRGQSANGYYEPLNWTDTSSRLTGQPGIGASNMPAQAQITYAGLTLCDHIAPSAIDLHTVKTYVQPTEIEIRTEGSVDDPTGIGVYGYYWYRDGKFLAFTPLPEIDDRGINAGSTHTYGIRPTDYDGNTATMTSFTVSTPSTAAVDPRQTGTPANGSFWGGMGEQINTRTGNLNYSYPLLTAVSRGWSVPLGMYTIRKIGA